MPTILFDLLTTQPSRSSQVHGGGVYGQRVFLSLVDQIEAHANKVSLSVAWNPSAPLPQAIQERLEQIDIERNHVNDYRELLQLVRSARTDRFYTPVVDWMFGRGDLNLLNGIDIRATIHQLRPLDAPGDQYARILQPSAAKRFYRLLKDGGAHRQRKTKHRQIGKTLAFIDAPILTVSNHSKFQILTEFPFIYPENIVVADSPISPQKTAFADDTDLPASLRNSDFLLMLNSNRGAKNAVRVVKAVHDYEPRALREYKVVLCGIRKDQFTVLMRKFPRARPYFEMLPSLEQPVLNLVMARAKGLLYPSISEGFGYPPLEAMGLGTPVLASPITSISEIVGDAALYLDPWSPNEIAYRLNQFVLDHALRRQLVERGYRRIQMYRDRQDEMDSRIVRALIGDWL